MAFTTVPGPAPCGIKFWPPQTEWLADYNRRSEYQESEIVALVQEIYNLLILFGYIRADLVEWAPTNGHAINENLCKELYIAPSVISLMKKLPYIKANPYGRGDIGVNLFPGSPQVSYLVDDQLRCGRKAESGGDIGGDVESHDLKLTDCDLYGTSVILDTKENVIRLFEIQFPHELKHPLAKPDYERHYRNVCARHAPSFLQRFIDRMRSLSLIPIHTRGAGLLAGVADFCDEILHENLWPRMKDILEESFGYLDNFARSEWQQQSEDIWERVMDEVDEECGGM